MENGKNIIFLSLILLILIPAGVIVGRNIKTDPIKRSLSSDKLLKILFIIEHENKVLSANIIAYYPQTHKAALFDVPYNIGLILPQLKRTDGIGALYTEKGVEAYQREVEKLSGVDIPFNITCSLSDFSHAIDLLGGISVFIPEAVDFDSEKYGKILLPSGSVLLDGDKIYDYFLYEHESDTEEAATMRKQKALLSFLRAINDHQQIFEKSQFNLICSFLRSNTTGNDFKQLLQNVVQLDSERLVPQRLTGAVRVVDSQELLFPYRDGQQIKEIIGQTLATLPAAEGDTLERVYALEILNATQINGLARKASELYQSFGYDVIKIDNAQETNREHTVLIDRIGNPVVANIVGRVIKCSKIETVSAEIAAGSETNADFTLILGKDFNGVFVKNKN